MKKKSFSIGVGFLYLFSGAMMITGNVFPEMGPLFYVGLALGIFASLRFGMRRLDAYFFLGPYFAMLGCCVWNYIFPYYTGILLAFLLCDLFARVLYKLKNALTAKKNDFLAIPLFWFLFDFLFQKAPILNSMHMIPVLSPLAAHPYVMIAASFWGAHAVFLLLAVLIAILIKVTVDRKITRPLAIVGATCLTLWMLPLLFNNLPKGNAEAMKANVTAVQGNYAPSEDEIGYEAEMERKLQYYLDIAGNLDTDIIVFPETSFGLYDTNHLIDEGYQKNLSDASKRLGALFVFCQIEGNSVTKSKEERFFCAALFDRGEILGITRKRNLVPFTESKQYSKGTAYDVYDTQFGKVGISVCYDVNAGTVERLKANGAQVILAPFNDRGFGGIYHNIHRYYPVIKAAECSIPVVVANEDGISQIVSGDGRILEELQYGDKGVIRHAIAIRDTLSVYLSIGRYVELTLFLGLLGWVARSTILRKRAMQTGKAVL